jgi:sulfhydrogenase subunit beta (sulfur reductase)
MRAFTEQDLGTFFDAAARDYDVRVPIHLCDGTRTLGRPGEGPLSLAGGPLPRKITAVFFPQWEAILHGQKDSQLPPACPPPLLVVGWTTADLEALAFLDEFFGARYRDTVYFRRRQDAILVGVSGWCGERNQLQRIAGTRCDFELACLGTCYVARPYSDRGQELISTIAGGVEVEDTVLDELWRASESLAQTDRQLLQAASRLLLEEKVPRAFWQKIADRCIACTACNLACPTCTCFDVFDQATTAGGLQRWRLWDSCQLDGFAREASGYNPLGEPRLRTRRRIHHKLVDDVRRWGHITCYLCGRCDRVCPTGIGMMAVCRAIVQEYGTNGT